MPSTITTVSGWTFDPSREVWFARVGENRWMEMAGALDEPPSMTPEKAAAWADDAPVWVRTCGHKGCILGGAHAHGVKA
jgi:hypothetical protein